jgi:hypothetical protein
MQLGEKQRPPVSVMPLAGVGELHFFGDFAIRWHELRLFGRLSTAYARSCRN